MNDVWNGHAWRDDQSSKIYRNGTHRAREPKETIDLISGHLSEMGITRVANVTGLDFIGIPVVMVVRPNSRSLAVSQGKGLTLDSARVSGIMESVETYCAERPMLPLKHASYREIRRHHSVVNVRALPARRGSLFTDDLPILWIEGYDLLAEGPVWVPYEMVHTNFTLPLPMGNGCFAQSSNGLASGNNLLEAASHAICEVVERDGSTLFSRHANPNERLLDVATVDDDHCRGLLKRYCDRGIAVRVWDISSDVGLPIFRCEIEGDPSNAVAFRARAAGVGCHTSRTVALSRALTEAAQSRLTAIAGSRDDLFRGLYDEDLSNRVKVESRATRSFHDAPSHDAEFLSNDVATQKKLLSAIGISSIIGVNLTLPGLPISVCRVIIPGLEGPHEIHGVLPGVRERTGIAMPDYAATA